MMIDDVGHVPAISSFFYVSSRPATFHLRHIVYQISYSLIIFPVLLIPSHFFVFPVHAIFERQLSPMRDSTTPTWIQC